MVDKGDGALKGFTFVGISFFVLVFDRKISTIMVHAGLWKRILKSCSEIKLYYYLASIQACFCFSLFNLNEVLFAVQTLHMCVYMYIRSHFGSRLSGSSSVNGQTCCHWIGFRCLFEFAFSVGPGPCSRHSPRACGAILGVLWIGGLRELPVGHLCWWHRHWGLHRAFGGSGLVAASEVAQVALGLLCN